MLTVPEWVQGSFDCAIGSPLRTNHSAQDDKSGKCGRAAIARLGCFLALVAQPLIIFASALVACGECFVQIDAGILALEIF